jgi:hypothetical protein
MEWSWPAWLVSVGAVVASGFIAWLEGNWVRRPGLGMGFANHGGMWGDLVLLSLANAAIVPHLRFGPWIAVAAAVGTGASLLVHRHWYTPVGKNDWGRRSDDRLAMRAGDHMWPTHVHGAWNRDLSWSGWAHVLYVIGELTLLAGFVMHAVPPEVVLLVAVIFTIHVPIGLLQPRYVLTGHIATVPEQPLLLPCLTALWVVTAVKI